MTEALDWLPPHCSITPQQRLFHLMQYHIVHAARFGTVQVFEILFQILSDTLGNIGKGMGHDCTFKDNQVFQKAFVR